MVAVVAAGLVRLHLPMSHSLNKQALVGNFKDARRAGNRAATAVNVHDFRDDALGRAVPDGIDGVPTNRGAVDGGASGDMPPFAVAAITRWWLATGRVA